MKIQTKYHYEKAWSTTTERDLLKIISDEIGDADPKGTLSYIKDAIKDGKVISVGDVKFKKEDER
jgi:hypothetical protein